MPCYDFHCSNGDCVGAKQRYESLLRHWTDQNPPCPHCGETLERELAAPACIWMKNWAEYGMRSGEQGVKDRQSPNWTPEGVWAYRTKSSRNADGSKEKVLLTTHSEMRSYCRDEGLVPPDDVNSNTEVSHNGHGFSPTSSQWI